MGYSLEMTKDTVIPMKSSKLYPEQVNVKFQKGTKRRIQNLKAKGVDTSKVCRDAILVALQKVEDVIKEEST